MLLFVYLPLASLFMRYKLLLDILAVGGAILGSTLIAVNIGMNVLGYLLFMVSSASSFILLRSSDVSKSQIIIVMYFMIINAVGFIRYSI